MLFRLYHSLMGLSKESLQHEAEGPEREETESGGGGSRGPELVDLGDDTDPEILVLVEKLRNLLKELPKTNLATLRYIIRHLRRSVVNSRGVPRLEGENLAPAPPVGGVGLL